MNGHDDEDIDVSEDELSFGPDRTENTENFIVVQPIENQVLLPFKQLEQKGIQTPTASNCSNRQNLRYNQGARTGFHFYSS